MLSAWVVTAVLGVWWLIEISYLRRHSTAPSRSWDKGSSRAWDVAHGIQLVGMLVGFLGIGGIDGARAGVQVSGLGLVLASITSRWKAIYTLGKLFTGRVQIQEGHILVRSGPYSRLRHPAYAGSLIAHLGIGLAFAN
jgi:protein-S-isoprenylcysteine O-methyltransferase Ste14